MRTCTIMNTKHYKKLLSPAVFVHQDTFAPKTELYACLAYELSNHSLVYGTNYPWLAGS